MKLFYAAAAVALAKQASAYRIVLANDNTYCIAQVKNDGNTDWTVTSNAISGLPSGSTVATDDTDGSPTIAQNGLNDPLDLIKTAVNDAAVWGAFVTEWTNSGPGVAAPATPDFTNPLPTNGITIYAAGATTPLANLVGAPTPGASVEFCEAYSTMAPDHYCKADGDYSNYQLPLKSDIQTCCVDNHSSGGMVNPCLLVSTGVPAMGDAEWYVDYTNQKCIRNCSPDNLFNPSSPTDLYTDAAYSYECGGLKPESDASWTAIDDCCTNRLTSLQPTYCAYRSEGGSATPPVPAVYPGTTPSKWYADASNSLCVQDCLTSSGGTCGGTVTAASTKLYTTAADCCSTSLPWVSECATRSSVGQGNPTNIFWASPDGCRMDCNNGDPNCATAPTSAKLYQTAADCCAKANSWVKKEYCETRAVSTFDESSSSSAGTDLWYVDYQDGVCRQDCNPTSGPSAGGSPAPCDWADNGSMTFYSTSTDCCKGALGSQNQDACVQASNSGATINSVATNKWYVTSDSDQPCAQDCATGTSNTACGGVIAKTGAKLYDSATECCKQAYAWVNEELCEKLSLNAAGAGNKDTDLWYVSYSDNACQQDCDPAANPTNPACHGTPSDISTPLYTTVEACCAARLGWINADTCKTSSETGASPSSTDFPGAGAWRKNDSWSSCVLDCNAGDTIPSGATATTDPIIGVQPIPGTTFAAGVTYPDQCDGVVSGATMYGNSVSNCCASISWVQKETCEAISTGVVSEMFFLDPSDSTKCVVQQAASTTGSTITCDNSSPPVVTGSANAVYDGVTCEEDITVSTKLYSTLKECCDANVSWDSENCQHASQGTQYQGSNNFYVDWSISKCVQDCPECTGNSCTGSRCGGVANAWDTMYSSDTACCGRLNWLPDKDCRFYQA